MRFSRENLTAQEVRELFNYDPETGVVTYAKRASNRMPGMIAGWEGDGGYRVIKIHGVIFAEHRIIWLHVHGRWPHPTTDHINGNPGDNRLANLREASFSLNNRNKRGAKGYHRHRNQWRAMIKVNGKQQTIGFFDTPEEARAAYVIAAKKAEAA